MKTAEKFFEEKNGGKSAQKALDDGELISPVWAVILMKEFASQFRDKDLIEKQAELIEQLEWNIFHNQKGDIWLQEYDKLKSEISALQEAKDQYGYPLTGASNKVSSEEAKEPTLNEKLETEIASWFYQKGIDTRFAHELFEYLKTR